MVKKQAKMHGASFNEYVTSVILRSIDDFSDGKEVDREVNTMTVLSMNNAEQADIGYDKWQPSNHVTGLDKPLVIKSDLVSTI